MKYITLIPTFIIAFVLQLSVMNLFTIFGIVPSLLLCLVLIITLLFYDEQRVIICGTIIGFMLDFVVGKYIGVYALVFFVEGIFTYFYKQYFNGESKISIIPLGIIGTLIYQGLPSIILALCGQSVNFGRVMFFFLISAILNIILMYIMYVILIKKATARPKRSRYERYEII